MVRLSGPQAVPIGRQLFHCRPPLGTRSRRVEYGQIMAGQAEIDRGLAWVLKGPRSYTGEDTVEISCHGSPLLLDRVVTAALGLGAVLARRGEFTQRAYLNGRLDLAQAEAVLDLIRAGSERERSAAYGVLAGGLGAQVARVRHHLTQALAIVEASLDFPENDLPPAHMYGALIETEEATSLAHQLVAAGEANEPWLGRIEVVITGPPNVGKSTLLNRLVGAERAIVDAEPGTTRDLVRAQCLWGGLAVEVVDTAGLRVPISSVEAEGIRRTQAAVAGAGVVLVVLDGSTPWQAEDEEAWRTGGARGVVVVNKADLPCRKEIPEEVASGGPVVWISATNGTGVEEMIAVARGMVRPLVETEGVVLTRERHRRCLAEVAERASGAGVTLRSGGLPECAAADLREALATAGEIVGIDVGEDVLETIFSEFCVGK